MNRLAIALCALLAGCGGTVVRDRPVTVLKPVAQPCAGVRPDAVVPIKDQSIDWDALDVKQKAALVAKQGLDHKTYGERLNAATAGCP